MTSYMMSEREQRIVGESKFFLCFVEFVYVLGILYVFDDIIEAMWREEIISNVISLVQ